MSISRRGVFIAGVVTAVATITFIQDWMGMEAYLAMAQDRWVHMSPLWWVPVIGIGLLYGVVVRLHLKPGDDVLLGNDGKPYQVTPIEGNKTPE